METAPAGWAVTSSTTAKQIDVPDEVQAKLWELWWSQERSQGRGWRGIAKAVVAHAPLAAIRHCASALGEAAKLEASGTPLKALQLFTESQRVANDGETALAVLEALEPHATPEEVRQQAAALLSSRAEDAGSADQASGKLSSAFIRLRLLTLPMPSEEGHRDAMAQLLRQATDLTAADAARLFAMATPKEDGEEAAKVLEALLKALGPDDSARPLVQAFLSKTLPSGTAEFKAACDKVQAIGATLWEAPRLRAELLQ